MMRYLFLIVPLLLVGCSSAPERADPRDPFESMNRSIYNFNDGFDKHLLKPVAKTYQRVVPQPVDDGISNFFGNLEDVYTLFNDILQLKFHQGASDFSRIVWNSTVGLFGIFDVATHLDLPKHREDLGQTFGYWGAGPGPYLVIPFLGPSSVRDGIGLATTYYIDYRNPILEIDDEGLYWSTVALRAIDLRADLLRASEVLESASLDEYTFLRDAYLQQRENAVYDGNPPMPNYDLLLEDELLLDEPAAQ